VGDVKQAYFDKEPRLTIYMLYLQGEAMSMSLVNRTSGAPAGFAAAGKAQARTVDKDQALPSIKPMDKVVREMLSGVCISSVLMMIFGIMALVRRWNLWLDRLQRRITYTRNPSAHGAGRRGPWTFLGWSAFKA
jgi:hypothetical protein